MEISESSLNLSLNRKVEIISRRAPDIWNLLNSKIYRGTDAYCDIRASLVEIASTLFLISKNDLSEVVKMGAVDEALCASMFVDCGLPTFFVSYELLQAALNTDLPEEIDWKTLKLPFESILFVLPRNGFLNSQKEEFQTLFCTRLLTSYPEVSKILKNDCFYFNATLINSSTDALCLTNSYFPDNHYIRKPGHEDSLTDSQALKKAGTAIFNILFAMLARPELVQSGTKFGKHKKSGKEIWTPNILGAKYRVQVKNQGGEHSSPRMHWRRGHYRLQRFGKNLTENRVIWIEPNLVNVVDKGVEK